MSADLTTIPVSAIAARPAVSAEAAVRLLASHAPPLAPTGRSPCLVLPEPAAGLLKVLASTAIKADAAGLERVKHMNQAVDGAQP